MREITDLAQKAASQYGLLTSCDVIELDVSTRQLTTFLAKGVLRRVRRGLFVLAGTVETWEHNVMRACLSGARRGVASNRTALRLWDLRPQHAEVEITVRALAAPRVPGAIVHRSYDLIPADVSWINGLPVTSPARTLCDAGVRFPDHEVERLVDAALGIGIVTVADLRQFRERVGRQGRTGVGALQRVLADLPSQVDRAESPKEIALLRLIRDHAVPEPVAQFTVVCRGHSFRIDLAYPEARVLLEYDGYREHTDQRRFAKDRQRQNLLMLDGWVVLRFSKVDLRDRARWVAAEIREAIAHPRLNLG